MRTNSTHFVWAGSALLAVTALFHLAGFPAISAPQTIDGAASFFEASLPPLWLFAGAHWLLIAFVCIVAEKSGQRLGRLLLRCCACVVLADALLLYWFIGPFVGVALLAASGLATTVGSFGKLSVPEQQY